MVYNANINIFQISFTRGYASNNNNRFHNCIEWFLALSFNLILHCQRFVLVVIAIRRPVNMNSSNTIHNQF